MQHNKVKGTSKTIPLGLGIGSIISLIITFIGSAVTAYLITTEKIGQGSTGYASLLILFTAAAMGAWGAVSSVKRLRLQICLLSGGLYYLILLAITALFFGGQYDGMGVTAIVTFIAVVLVAIIPTKTGQKISSKKRAYR